MATELHSDPSVTMVLREFSSSGTFGREIEEMDVECHVLLGGTARVSGGADPRELSTGDCVSLSGEGTDRIQAARGARVLSVYSPSITLDAMVRAAAGEEAVSADR